jgi:uncharacterized membrane protein
VGLSPEERKRIYEEEKTRIEAEQQVERESERIADTTSTGLSPKTAGLLCYLGWWISGIIFLILEQKNNWVRFHALQSIIVFGILTVIGSLLKLIPVVGTAVSSVVWIIGFIFWIILMVKAYSGELYKLGWAGDIAEKIVTSSGVDYDYRKTPPASETKAVASSNDIKKANTNDNMELHGGTGRKVKDYLRSRRSERIASSAFAIAWSIVLLVLFGFFHEYIAYYSPETVGREVVWTRLPFFTNEIDLWLPVLMATLGISIIGHIILLIFDKYILREVFLIIIDAFGIVTVITLLAVFPFDFYVIPSTAIASGVQIGVTVTLVFISVVMGISILVRVIKLIVNIARGVWNYQEEA